MSVEDDRPARNEGSERLLVTNEAGKLRPAVLGLLGSMAFTAVTVLASWPIAFAIGGGAGVVASWIVLALERKRERARREARAEAEADARDDEET